MLFSSPVSSRFCWMSNISCRVNWVIFQYTGNWIYTYFPLLFPICTVLYSYVVVLQHKRLWKFFRFYYRLQWFFFFKGARACLLFGRDFTAAQRNWPTESPFFLPKLKYWRSFNCHPIFLSPPQPSNLLIQWVSCLINLVVEKLQTWNFIAQPTQEADSVFMMPITNRSKRWDRCRESRTDPSQIICEGPVLEVQADYTYNEHNTVMSSSQAFIRYL